MQVPALLKKIKNDGLDAVFTIEFNAQVPLEEVEFTAKLIKENLA